MRSTTFFEQQARARRNTKVFIGLFVLAVLCIVAVINAVVIALAFAEQPPLPGELPTLVGITSVGVLLVIGLSMLIRISQLAAGGTAVAESMGGTRVMEDTRDPQLRRLRNVVEEMSIAAGIPVPAIYVLEEEDGLNAFAAGYSPADAAVAVTRGCLDRLNRDELQGVIAHEYSHVLNGDMRLNIRLMGWLFGILSLAIIGQRLLRSMRYSRNRNNGGAIAIVALALMIVGYVGVFFGHLIKAAVSRSREYLADASAVQFTRQNAGIVGALKKIAGLDDGSALRTADSEDVSHMLFANGLRNRFLATHPPITKRIQALDPQFRPEQLDHEDYAQRFDGLPVAGFAEARVPLESGAAPTEGSGTERWAAAAADLPASAAAVIERTGTLRENPLRMAAHLRDSLPDALTTAARTPTGAQSVLLALLIDTEPSIAAQQIDLLEVQLGSLAAARACDLQSAAAALHPLQRSPLVAMALPALRRLPRSKQQTLRELVPALIHADARVELHEYVIGAMLEAHLDDALQPGGSAQNRATRLSSVQPEVDLLLGVMARVGHAVAQMEAAFNVGRVAILGATGAMPDLSDWHQHLDNALQRLDGLPPAAKQQLLEGLTQTMLHNHRINVDEYELLRACCAALRCPLPALGVEALADIAAE